MRIVLLDAKVRTLMARRKIPAVYLHTCFPFIARLPLEIDAISTALHTMCTNQRVRVNVVTIVIHLEFLFLVMKKNVLVLFFH